MDIWVCQKHRRKIKKKQAQQMMKHIYLGIQKGDTKEGGVEA